MIQIPLTQGKTATVDDCDADLLEQKWYCSKGGYAARRKDDHTSYKMHRVILARKLGRPLVSEEEVDHINHRPADNRRANLRVATRGQNNRNRLHQRNNRSGFMGVCYHRGHHRWQALIRKDGKRYHLGYFSTPERAAQAYDEAARKLHGAYATLNFS